MRFMILINNDEAARKAAPPAELEAVTAAYRTYTQDLHKAGVLLGGDALEDSSKGARIRIEGGKRSVVDGPFAETKEVIGGFYLIQVKSREEAIEWASRCPGTPRGGVEVRQLRELG